MKKSSMPVLSTMFFVTLMLILLICLSAFFIRANQTVSAERGTVAQEQPLQQSNAERPEYGAIDRDFTYTIIGISAMLAGTVVIYVLVERKRRAEELYLESMEAKKTQN